MSSTLFYLCNDPVVLFWKSSFHLSSRPWETEVRLKASLLSVCIIIPPCFRKRLHLHQQPNAARHKDHYCLFFFLYVNAASNQKTNTFLRVTETQVKQQMDDYKSVQSTCIVWVLNNTGKNIKDLYTNWQIKLYCMYFTTTVCLSTEII